MSAGKSIHFKIFLLILLAGAILRFWRLEALTTFSGDQGYDFAQVKKMVNDRKITLLGPKIGPYNGVSTLYLGPFYYYLLAPFLLIAKFDPIGAAVAVVLARLATVIFVYLIAKDLFGKAAGNCAAAICAFSPYWVNSLGPPSNPYFIPPIVLGIIFIHLKIRKRYFLSIAAAGLLTGLAFQLHYLAIILMPSIFIYFLFKKETRKLRYFIYAIGGFLAGISPVIAFELKHEFFLTSQILKQFNSGIISVNFYQVFTKINGLGVFLSKDLLGFGLPFFLIIVLVLTVSFARRENWQSREPIFKFLLILVLANIVAATLYFGKIQPHYLAVSYPIYFIFTGFVISKMGKINRFLPIVIIITISILLIRGNNLFSGSGYTMPQDLSLAEIRSMSKIIAQDIGSDKFNITSTLDGDSRAMPYRYLVDVFGKTPQSVENYDKVDSLYVITRDPARSVRENKLFEIASFQPSNVAADWEIRGDIHLIKLTKGVVPVKSLDKFITVVNPVRSRDFWADKSIENLKNQFAQMAQSGISATWLLAYDNLFDREVIDLFKNQGEMQEVGAFLEVSQKWATDSGVSYKVADGDYYRPDKVFLSGYSPRDRKKLINKYFQVFSREFGVRPKSVGAWYIDSYSQEFLSKLGVTAALTVADQFDTDAETVWGKYFSFPYYPSKYNSLEPASDQSSKIPVVNLQWAQRDPVAGYGKGVYDSRQSFQANDYLNNRFGHAYFTNLLSTYLSDKKTDFMQITIGLEAGQEAASFSQEFTAQLQEISNLAKSGQIKILKMSDFAGWYRDKYPGVSPSHFLEKGESFWYMSPKFRVALFAENGHFFIKDLRYYSIYPARDYFYKDTSRHLEKEVSPTIDALVKGNQIDLGLSGDIKVLEKFDRLILTLDWGTVEINTKGVLLGGEYLVLAPQTKIPQSKLDLITIFNRLLGKPKFLFNFVKYSKIDGAQVFGFAPTGTKLIGLRGLVPGVYTFDFQTLSKFKSPAQILDKWQPWIF